MTLSPISMFHPIELDDLPKNFVRFLTSRKGITSNAIKHNNNKYKCL